MGNLTSREHPSRVAGGWGRGKGKFEQMEEEGMGWGERYVLDPGGFGVRVLPPGLQPEEGPPVMRSLPSREGGVGRGWKGEG